MASSKKSFGGWIVFVIVIAAAGAVGWYFWKVNADKPAEYTSATVSRGSLTQTVTATGTLQAVTTVDVSSQISGNIAKLYVDWNSPVKKGQVLAEIDPSAYQTALQQAEGQLANAKANLQLMNANATRSKELFEQKLIPQSDLDTAVAQAAQAEAQVKIQTAAYSTAQVNLSRCTIYSPIDGSVITRNVDVGNTVAASLSAPVLFQIANDLKTMQIDAAISEADIGNIQEKQRVTFTVDAYPNRQFHGVVSQIRNSPKTTQNVVVYDTMIDVPNSDLKLKPGMTASVSVIAANRPNVLKVSNGALRARIPDSLLPAKPVAAVAAKTADGKPAAAPAKPLTEAERRQQMQDLMRDAGFVRGNGPPSPEVIAKIHELAKERGIELPERFGGGRDSNQPVTRTLYLLAQANTPAQHPEPVTVKLGISDGMSTEVLDGLKEGDVVITGVVISGAKNAPASNPFGGGRRF